MCFIDRKVSIFGDQRYVKAMYFFFGGGSELGMYFHKTGRYETLGTLCMIYDVIYDINDVKCLVFEPATGWQKS